MQPYFLPYIGYWQMMHAVDEFVIYDDVQFSKGGWINRNRLLLAGAPHIFTLPLAKGNLRDRICERQLPENWPGQRQSLQSKIENAYGRAPFFADAMPVIASVLAQDGLNLADFLVGSLQQVRAYLGIETPLLRSSRMGVEPKPSAAERVLAICRARSARIYVNAPGGRDLYDRGEFASHGIALKFIQPGQITYPQFKGEFVPSLSILDVMMFNSRDQIRAFLDSYTLE